MSNSMAPWTFPRATVAIRILIWMQHGTDLRMVKPSNGGWKSLAADELDSQNHEYIRDRSA